MEVMISGLLQGGDDGDAFDLLKSHMCLEGVWDGRSRGKDDVDEGGRVKRCAQGAKKGCEGEDARRSLY